MLMNCDEIAEAVVGEEIFNLREDFLTSGWEKQLRVAAYDLRVDRQAYVKRQGKDKHQPVSGAFTLQPGDIAVMRSAERLCLDWTIATNLVPKFSSVRDGLHVLHGGLADPGFGRRWKTNGSGGEWKPADDERIVWLVANVSDTALTIDPATRSIISIQFFRIKALKVPKTGTGAENMSTANYWDDVVHDRVEHLGLQFFQDSRIWESRLTELYNRMSEAMLLVVFVLGVAAFGAVAAVLVALLDNAELRGAAETPSTTLVVIGIALVVGLYVAIAIALRGWLARTAGRLGRGAVSRARRGSRR